jgi:hypothetical protein
VPTAAEVLSPELVLVSPPEVAARARLLLADPRPFVPRPVERDATSNGVALFYAGCIAGTLGPFLLAVLSR